MLQTNLEELKTLIEDKLNDLKQTLKKDKVDRKAEKEFPDEHGTKITLTLLSQCPGASK